MELKGEVATLRTGMERLTALVEALVTAQNQPPPSPPPPYSHHPTVTEVQTTVISEINSMPISVAPVITPHYRMPRGYPWGMPDNFMPKGYKPIAVEISQPVQPMQPMMTAPLHWCMLHHMLKNLSTTLSPVKMWMLMIRWMSSKISSWRCRKRLEP